MEIKEFLDGFEEKRAGLLPILYAFQEEKASITAKEVQEVAEQLKLEFAEIKQVAEEVVGIEVRETPKRVIKVCTNIHCDVAGSDKLIHFLCQTLKVNAGEISKKNDTAFVATKCFGYCDIGPNVEINGKLFDEVTTEKLAKILKPNG